MPAMLNAVLAAAAYNFHLLLKWMELLLSRFLTPRKAIAALHRVKKTKTSRTREYSFWSGRNTGVTASGLCAAVIAS
jgi:hypothetical protein